MKVCVIGHSVGLRIRPPRENRKDGNFAEILELLLREDGCSGLSVQNLCNDYFTVDNLYKDAFIPVVRKSPDVVIIICGINDAVSRPLPQSLYKFLNKPRPNKKTALKIFQKINSMMNRYVFPYFIKLFRLKGWKTEEQFVEILFTYIDLVQKETCAHCIIINILPCTERIERMLPGSSANIEKFNIALNKVITKKNKCHLIDISAVVNRDNISEKVPDGIHMNAAMHRKTAELIKEKICLLELL
jgi:lysophospholipase L1-like esterase